jgi:hypothetical protein
MHLDQTQNAYHGTSPRVVILFDKAVALDQLKTEKSIAFFKPGHWFRSLLLDTDRFPLSPD